MKTNFDVIMESPEKLAKVVAEGHPNCGLVKCDLTTCEQCWLNWLNSPAKEE